MPTHEQSKPVPLSSEDQGRLMRLREEILGRADEMSRIINRTVKRRINGPIGKFSLVEPNAGGHANGSVEYWKDGKLVAVGCWDEEAQECYPGPCPDN